MKTRFLLHSFIVLATSLFLLTSCSKRETKKLIGTWYSIENTENEKEILKFNDNDKFELTYIYYSEYDFCSGDYEYDHKNKSLVLKQTYSTDYESLETMSFKVDVLDEETLVLNDGGDVYVFNKE